MGTKKIKISGVKMKRHFVCGFLGLAMATALGRLDHESQSLIDVFQFQIWPALLIYGFAFYLFFLLLTVGLQAALAVRPARDQP